ncbi:MAG TPA: GSCFA domain-containing protein, partial [Rhodocyclaceae bacterium]
MARHKTASVQPPEQIAAQLREAFACFRAMNPRLRIVVTVSPVPLEASFQRNLSILAADCLSKSTLRNAVSLVTDPDNGIYYFPSFEFVRWLCPLVGLQPYARDDGHPRHVSNNVVASICLLFAKYFSNAGVYAACLAKAGTIDSMREANVSFSSPLD